MRKKQRLLVGLASLTLFDIAGAAAADMPVKAPVLTPVPDWAGFYIGGHAGYRWADPNFSSPSYNFNPGGGTITFPARDENYRVNSGIVGVQGGHNFLLTPRILAGVEGDWSWGSHRDSIARSFSGSSNDGFTFRGISEVNLTWQATIRGRLGVVSGSWLVYVTGGVAFIHAEWSDTSTLTTFFKTIRTGWSADEILTGWVGGGGVEYMFDPKWIGRIEYLYEHFGSFGVPQGLASFGTLDIGAVQKLRVAVSYKFGP